MIAVIRVRFNNTPADAVWSDEVMHNWMNPGIEYSLGHFWARSSFFQADLRYYLFPAIAMDDPRVNTPAGGDLRQYLVDGVTAEVTRLYKPDWKVFDSMLICFAQMTDLFGGGAFPVPVDGGQKYLTAAVCDIASPFSSICQEVGHAFGLDHEVDQAGNEYMSPYSSMSSESYGGATSSFQRPEDPRLPKGTMPGPDTSAVVTNDVQRIIGPYMTPVQIYNKGMGVFKMTKSVYQLPDSYHNTPHSFRLIALDQAIDTWPQQQVALAVLPSSFPNNDTYFLELRRNNKYDSGLSLDGTDLAPIGVVIHAVNASNGRVRYVDRIALAAAPGDRDYHCFAGHFTVRVNSFEQDYSAANVTVGGGDFWKYFGVDIDDVITDTPFQSAGEWTSVDVSPCFMFQRAPYQYRYLYNSTQVLVVASSFGYEKPFYRWFVNDVALDPAASQITLRLSVKLPENGKLSAPQEQDVVINYQLTQNRVRLSFNQQYSGIYISIKVMVNESSQEVLQNFYPDRTIVTGMSINNVTIEWDQAYQDAQKACGKKIADLNEHYAISEGLIPHRDPGPKWEIHVVELIDELMQSNPAAASVVISEVARLGNVSRLEVIKRLR